MAAATVATTAATSEPPNAEPTTSAASAKSATKKRKDGGSDVAQPNKKISKSKSRPKKFFMNILRTLACKTYRRAPLRNRRVRCNVTPKAKEKTIQQDLETMRMRPISFGYDFASCVDAYLARLAISWHAHWLQWP